MHETISQYLTRGGTITIIPARGKNDKQTAAKQETPPRHRIAKASALCVKCRNRDDCTELCARAEAYASQDDNPDAWRNIRCSARIEDMASPISYPQTPAPSEALLVDYFCHRRSIADIAKTYAISQQYTRRVVKKHKAILEKIIKIMVSR